ncbi:hypothetical protein AGDE_00255 [Angomonas deanei]|uniref:Activator of Hsp90 ATPase, N-terminal/Activator of Hsp90 ATPase homolog 1-like protein, putative n=1 Tax=Angomonas deanei TaxID=59799 RepID=S9WW13_9TRYP|nr:hypothetical protein AGDE_11854 [Angomonas deanei]EPY39350.1 hypothetical protein AGDE_04578 [Angomonas deanei]EPY40120.1 hypothetical protein AGDE_03808 [Angomonas deanei]EPY43666.1 hypothetical protein AGDE_00255 [Angomonas deanei]CAD2222231.1 Activator of Hsp90 ATPase, N-terminal/Activator of Hsp90 ATPase homolog 1-like protein, putative [Angomonas deanei]|eukprot:EPY25353.1 hypothetical protein AGDE_11854 [Angomonas deanei]
MAKVGEGDPRWIVSERKDGANVNSWHWEERDLSKHTHEELKRRFKDCAITDNIKISEVSEISGDVTVAQRKGKMMCYFELKLQLKWTGEDEEGNSTSGKLEVPEVDHDEFRNEYEVHVTCADNDAAAGKMESVVREKGRKVVRSTIEAFFDKIFEEYHIGQMLKSGASMPPPPKENQVQPTTAAKSTASPSSSEMTSFSLKMRWGAPIDDLYDGLLDQQKASLYTRAPAKIDPKTGGQFEFLGGVISGYYSDLKKPSTIMQQWRLRSWPVGVHSTVRIELVKEQPAVTVLKFNQTHIPAGELESVREGWRANFFDAMKIIFQCSMEYI